MPNDDEYVAGICDHCGNTGEVLADSKLCEQCDHDSVMCSICGEIQFDGEGTCRHVFYTEYGWTGAGVGANTNIKPALFYLFDRMPSGFATDLRTAIHSGKFHTWMVSPIIGPGGTLTLHGMPSRDRLDGGNWAGWAERWWGSKILELGEQERDESDEYMGPIEEAYYWLASLYDRDTKEANQETIKWIDEYFRKQTGPRARKGNAK